MDHYPQKEHNLHAIYDRNSLDAPDTNDSSLSLSDWCQWGFIRPEKFEPSNIDSGRYAKPTEDGTIFYGANLSAEFNKRPLVYNGKGSNSKDNGELIFGHRSRIAADGQSECQMQSSMNWTDELLKNSVLQEDNGNMQKSLQQFNIPDSISGSQSFENLLTNMLTDAQSLTRDQTILEATEISNTIQGHANYMPESRGMIEDSLPQWLMVEEYKRSKVSAIELNASKKSVAVASGDESASWEALSLMELEDILIYSNEDMRVCFRDSLYRLVNNSTNQHAVNHYRSVNNNSFIEVNSGSSSLGGLHHGEPRTNVIDRTIANLIFNDHYLHAPDVPCSPESYDSAQLPVHNQY